MPETAGLESALKAIGARILPDGGFSQVPGGPAACDATAWAILAFRANGTDGDKVAAAQERLTGFQWGDGRVALTMAAPSVWWPTSLALLAWSGVPEFAAAVRKATNFLLATSGIHFPKPPHAAIAHDTSIRGWSWVVGTHSWVDPTSFAVMALQTAGEGRHKRVLEAVRMLLDRQLPHGGWNYGNTVVFGHELKPFPDSTGLALNALVGHTEKERIQKSLEYLKEVVPRLRTPLSLSWAILGLGAWNQRPGASRDWLIDCLSRQRRYGPYHTSLLAQIVVAYHASAGLLSTLRSRGD